MKQSLKYGIFLIFALLLHSAMMDVTKEIVIPDIHSYEECSVSQARPVRNAIEKIYHFYSVLSCEMGYSDLSHVPTDKNFIRLTARQCEYKDLIPPDCIYSSHQYTHNPADPIVFYIYGQRKILI